MPARDGSPCANGLAAEDGAMADRIQIATESITRAWQEKEKLEGLLQALEKFHQDRLGNTNLPFPRFSAYDEDLMKYLEEARKRFKPHLGHIETYTRELIHQRDGFIQQQRHKSSSAIHRLPFEVLGAIFTACVSGDIDESHETKDIFLDHTPLTVSSVNGVWRDAALRSPTVWSRLAVNVCPKPRAQFAISQRNFRGLKKMDFARTWIERSGVTPLYLSVEWVTERPDRSLDAPFIDGANEEKVLDETRRRWVDWIASLTHRVVYFHLKGPNFYQGKIPHEGLVGLLSNPFPRLGNFVLSGNLEVPRDPPHLEVQMSNLSCLRTVTIHGGGNSQLDGCFQALEGLNSLESLSIETWGYKQRILSTLLLWLPLSTRKSLRYLDIEYSSASWWEDSPQSVIELPNLSELRIHGLFGIFPVFLDIFSLPALDTLLIEGSTEIRHDSARSGKDLLTVFFEEARFPSLRNFALKSVRAVDDQLTKFLRAHPNLASLRFCNLSILKTMAGLAKYPRTTRQPLLCPRLERLDMAHIRNRGAEDSLAELFTARYEDAQPAESYSELTKKFQRLESLIWDGIEQILPSSPI